MTDPTWTFNNFCKTERIRPKFHPIIENHSHVKSSQFPRAPYSHAVWRAISDTIKWTPLVLASLQLSHRPRDVAVVDNSTAAVSMLNGQIVTIDVEYRGQLSERKNIQINRCVHGITAYNKNLILACQL